MYILIAGDGSISLQDSENMGAFSVHEEVEGAAVTALAKFAVAAENQHLWIDADAVVELAGRQQDSQWVERFWEMLAKVEAYGFSDMHGRRVKAHVEPA